MAYSEIFPIVLVMDFGARSYNRARKIPFSHSKPPRGAFVLSSAQSDQQCHQHDTLKDCSGGK
jgi:hypothetical protein